MRSIRISSAIGLLVAAVMLGAAGGGSAATTAVPTAITGSVTAIGPTTATVTGTVNANGQATTWWVEYGTSTSYGSKTANVNAGSGTSNSAVAATLTSLAPVRPITTASSRATPPARPAAATGSSRPRSHRLW